MKNIKKYIPKNDDGKIESVLWEWDENKKQFLVRIFTKDLRANGPSDVLFKFYCDMVSDDWHACTSSPKCYSSNFEN